MERNDEKKMFFALLRNALQCGDNPLEIPTLSEQQLAGLYVFADRYDLAQVAGYSLQKLGRLPGGMVGRKFQKKQVEAIWRTEQLAYEKERIGDALENAGIPHIFLKGTVLRPFYPEPWLRTSADIDLLVQESMYDQTVDTLCEELGYTKGLRSPCDMQVVFPTGFHAEVHKALMKGSPKAAGVFSGIWEEALPVENKIYEKQLSPDIFATYFIAHMAEHFTSGGCGIRPFMDWKLMEERLPYDLEQVNALLQRTGLLTFAQTAERLRNYWFADGEADALTKKMETYLLRGGTYGGAMNKVAVGQIRQGGRVRNFLDRVWMPYQTLKRVYPALDGHKWLMPYFEVRRWCRLVFCGEFRHSMGELDSNRRITKEEVRSVGEFMKELELL